jgi:hypothetical protein
LKHEGSRVPGECSSRACASGTRPGTQRRHDGTCQCPSILPRSSWVPGLAALARDTSVRTRGAQSEPLAMVSNSRCQTAQSSSFPRRVYAPGFVCPVRPGLARGFGVEAAVTLAAIPAAAIPLHPERGVDGAPTGALFSFVARARRDHHAPVRPGPLSALHRGDFRPGTRAGSSGSGTGSAQRPVRRRTEARLDGVPGPPRCGSRRRRGTPLLAPSQGSSPDDAPHEPGYKSHSTYSLRSQ